MNYFGISLHSRDIQHGISLTVTIALIVIYLIGHFVISANSMQFAFYIGYGINYKRLTSYQLNINIEKIYVCEQAEQQSLDKTVTIFAFIRYKNPISFNFWTW